MKAKFVPKSVGPIILENKRIKLISVELQKPGPGKVLIPDYINSQCRLCMRRSRSLKNVQFHKIEDYHIYPGSKVSDVLKASIGLKLKSPGEGREPPPEFICHDCCEKLKSFMLFKTMCFKNEWQWLYGKIYANQILPENILQETKKLVEMYEEKPVYDEDLRHYDQYIEEEIYQFSGLQGHETTKRKSESKPTKPIDELLVNFKFKTNIDEMIDYLENPNHTIDEENKELENILEDYKDVSYDLEEMSKYAMENFSHQDNGSQTKAYIDGQKISLKGVDIMTIVEFQLKDVKELEEGKVDDLKTSRLKAINVPSNITCCGCSEIFVTKKLLEKHRKTNHPDTNLTGEYRCRDCSKRFNECPNYLRKKVWKGSHNVIWDPKKCCGCHVTFETHEDLIAHRDIEHLKNRYDSGEKPFECELCYQRFTVASYLVKHRREVYFKYTCTVCGERFGQRLHAISHERIHIDQELYQCQFCPGSFKRKDSLNNHMISKHNGNGYNGKLFECDLCGRKRCSMVSLKIHMKTHQERPSKPRIYSCHICSKSFVESLRLKRHIASHTQTKHLKCRYCDQRFIHTTDRKRHEIGMHTHEYEHVCNCCQKGFLRRDTCEKHKLTCGGGGGE